MVAFGWLVLTLVFLDELLAVASTLVWGQHVAGWWLGVLAAVVVVEVWALFASPRARLGGPVVRPVVKVLVVALAGLGLWVVGLHGWAVAFWLFSVFVNALAQVPAIRDLPAGNR